MVVDASLLAKVVLKEDGWENVPLTINTATLDYAFVEALNAIWKARVKGMISESDAGRKLEALLNLEKALLIFKSSEHFDRGLQIALNEKITVYDALYIALAESNGVALYTGDSKQFSAAKKYVKTELLK